MWKNYGVARNSTVKKAVCTDKENVLAIGSSTGNYTDLNWYQKTWTSSVVSLPISNQPDPVGPYSYLSMGGRCVYCSPDNNFIQYNKILNKSVLSTYQLNTTTYTTNIFIDAEGGYLTDDKFYWIFDTGGPYSNTILVFTVGATLPIAYQVQIDFPFYQSVKLFDNAPDGRLFGVLVNTRAIGSMFSILPDNTTKTVNVLYTATSYVILDIRYVSDQYVYVAYNDYTNPQIQTHDLYIWVGPIGDIDLSKGRHFPQQNYVQSLYSNQNLYVITEQNNTIYNRFGLYTIPVSGTTNIVTISLPTEPTPGSDVDNNETPGWQSPPVPVNTPNLTFYNWINCVMMYNNATSEVGVAVGLNVSKTIFDGTEQKTVFKYTADTIFYALCKDGECVDVVKNRVPCTKQPKRNLCVSTCIGKFAEGSDNYLPLDTCTDYDNSDSCKSDVWGKCSDTGVSISQYIDSATVRKTFIPIGTDTDPRNQSFYKNDCKYSTIYGSLATIQDFYQTVGQPKPSLDNLCMMNPVFKSNLNPNSTTYQPFVCDYTLCVANRQVPIIDLVALRGNLNIQYPDPTVGDDSQKDNYLSVTAKEVQDNIDAVLLAACTTNPAVYMQNPKCQSFCSNVSGDTKRQCDDAVIEYCKASGPSVFCSCLQSKQFLSECLDYSCTNNGDSYYTQKVKDFVNGTGCPSVCQTVIEVNKTGGNVNIDNNSFKIQCSNSSPSSGLASSGLAATAAATPSLNKWYGIGSDGKCGEIPGLDYSKSSEYRDCIAQNNRDYPKCEQDLLTSLKIPTKYYSSLLDCEKAKSNRYNFFLAFAIVSAVTAIFMVWFGVVQKKKAFWATGIGFVVVAIGLSVAAAT